MDLKKILNELSVDANFTGSTQFETLGVSNERELKAFCTFIDDKKFVKEINENIAVVLTTEELSDYIVFENKAIVKNPRSVFFRIHEYLINSNSELYVREEKKTIIGNDCKIGKHVDIAERNVIIGNNVIIESFVTIKENSIIGDNVVIRSGVTIGGEGFEVKNDGEQTFVVQHGGGTIIGNNVEIQHNSVIDKALYPWDNTVVEEYTKIDNLVHIAHGVKVGKKCVLTAKTTIGGRTIIKDNCYLGLASTVKQLLTVGADAVISMGAVVSKNVPDKGHVTGNLAIDHNKMMEYIKRIS